MINPVSFFFRSKKSQKGFTLLELLVVISIIGILIALGTASFSTAQKKGRDARRKGDMKALSQALEQYYAENTNSYPPVNGDCRSNLVSGKYLQISPEDPKNDSANGYTYGVNCTASSYCVCAKIEDGVSGNNSSKTDCTAFSSSGAYFCARNQQ